MIVKTDYCVYFVSRHIKYSLSMFTIVLLYVSIFDIKNVGAENEQQGLTKECQ